MDMNEAWALAEEIGTDGWALISDDDGQWAWVCDGMQNVRVDRTSPLFTSFDIHDALWASTPQEAIRLACERMAGA